MNFSSIFVATTSEVKSGTVLKNSGHEVTSDSNGLNPVVLTIIAGKVPNRNWLSGTLAKSLNIESGKTYLMQVRETAPSVEYGRQFQYSVLKEMDALEIIQSKNLLGDAIIFDVKSNSGVEENIIPESAVNVE